MKTKTLPEVLESLPGLKDDLRKLLLHLSEACRLIADDVRSASTEHAGTQNLSGDHQLDVDLLTDKIVFDQLRASKVVNVAGSEETAKETSLQEGSEGGFSVAFDPLDGSSVVDVNFAVGSIFGIWPGAGLLGRCGREQVASMISIYGPRATIMLALSDKAYDGPAVVMEFTLVGELVHGESWICSREKVTIAEEGKVFAPGNLRATQENDNYARMVDYWMKNKYTLRYTGAMVPDVYHVLIKGKGIFSTPPGKSSKVKLRLLYECAPIGLIVESAGGMTSNGTMSVLDVIAEDMDQRTPVVMGSKKEVERFMEFEAMKFE